MVESWWFQAMAQDGYARHGLHKHHVGCSAKGHGWRGQICQVFFFFFGSCGRSQGDTFFSSGLLFRSLKGNWPLFGETTSGKHHRLIPKVCETPPSFEAKRLKPPSPEQFAKDTSEKGHRKCHFFRVPPKKTEESEDFLTWGNAHPITHVLDPWWSHLVYAGTTPKLLIDEILCEFGWLERRNQFDICHINWSAANFVHQHLLVPTLKCAVWQHRFGRIIMYPTLGKNRFRKISSKQRRK